MKLLNRLRRIAHPDAAARELEEELRAHRAMTEARLQKEGLSADEARAAASRSFGNMTLALEDSRGAWKYAWLDHFWRDVRFGARALRKSPGFSSVCILTLALGIGANTAIFSIVNGVLLRPLPFLGARSLVMLSGVDHQSGRTHDVISYPAFVDWRAQSTSFQTLAAYSERTMTLSSNGVTELVHGIRVSPGFFEILGVAPELGRTFRPDEERPGTALPAILSDAFWKQQFGGNPGVLGETMRLAIGTASTLQPLTIVGVMPPQFKFSPGAAEEVYVPVVEEANRGHGWLFVVGRLRSGVSLAQAQAEMDIVTRHLAQQYPKGDDAYTTATVEPLAQALVGDTRAGLLFFLGVVGLVLLICCTNVANLIIARSAVRQKEFALRAALGAGRDRLIQQMLTESTILALAGGAIALLLAAATTHLLTAWLGKHFEIPRIEDVHTDASVMAFTFVLAILTGILFGLAPAVSTTTPDVHEQLRESGRAASGGPRSRRLQSALMIAETALALVLLAGAGLLLKSLLIMRQNAPGFDTADLVTVDCWMPASKFSTPLARTVYFNDLLTRIDAAPGVRSAALVADLPLGGGSDGLSFHIAGKPDPAPNRPFQSNFNIVSPGYFRTMGTRLLAGREFTRDDSVATAPVVIINQAAAKYFWPGEDALGRQISLDGKTYLTVVGIAADIRNQDLASPAVPEIFIDYLQPGPDWPWLVLVARTAQDPAQAAPMIKAVAAQVDRDVPFVQVRTMDDVLASSMAQPQVYTIMIGAAALLALALAAVGIYGIVSYSAAQRTHEMGIRLALGASRGNVMALVLRQVLALVFIGLVLGIAGAIAATRSLTNLVRSIQPGDPLILLAISTLLLAVAFAASVVPAWRATRVDPMVALRHE